MGKIIEMFGENVVKSLNFPPRMFSNEYFLSKWVKNIHFEKMLFRNFTMIFPVYTFMLWDVG